MININNKIEQKTILLIGDKSTGKTSLLKKYIKNKYEEDIYLETLGIL
jgi:GTPase SAR1 family protein